MTYFEKDYLSKRDKRLYFVASTNFSIPLVQRDKGDSHPIAHYLLCLNCPLDKCYRDGMKDSTGDHEKMVGIELCPIEIAKNK